MLMAMSDTAKNGNSSRPALPFRKKLLFSVVAVVAGLLLIEILARFFLATDRNDVNQTSSGSHQTRWFDILRNDLNVSEPAKDLYVPHPTLIWTLKPNTTLEVDNEVYQMRGAPVTWTFDVNGDGHRGPAYPSEHSQDYPVVVCLGDSCTFGFRVDRGDTYPARLAAFLRDHGMPNASVVNYGIPGYSSFQGRLVLEGFLERYRPDVVILAFGANDLEPDDRPDVQKAEGSSTATNRIAPLLNRLAIAKLVGRFKSKNPQRGGLAAEGQVRVSIDDYRNNLQAMVRMAQAAGARVVLLDFILSGQIDRNGTAYRTTISTLAADQKLDWLDCLAILRAALANPQRLKSERAAMDKFWDNDVVKYRRTYYDNTVYDKLLKDPVWRGLLRYFLVEPVHPNALGHQVIAEAVGQVILGGFKDRGQKSEGRGQRE